MHSSPVPEEQRVLDAARGLLRDIGRLSYDLYRAGEFGLSRSHTSVLDALETRSRRVTELAAFTGLTQPRVTVVLQELAERGLAERVRCATDRRAVDASITPAGRQYLEDARRRMAAAIHSGLTSPATPAEDPERTVASAREAVRTLLDALHAPTEAEVS
ncbi:MarR family winged helix-turn-helix transcriptional regulator [Streptomyces montanisoli]|uniref:MarR family transcriptional regulator n=1 Tax=Streptomyces montanisoli TaxID=2798581 RepID=A0A940MHX8_9ACTN|nr:MarR family transcriptional regulator [Streptomyces montanisoli]MBP0461539.1 MarR family transcriptional regulator [Streptomyces montanisoli]